MPAYLPAMKFLKDRDVREKLYRAFVTRAGEENTPLLDQILSLKQQQAKLLGFGSYAEMSMARTHAAARTLTLTLTPTLTLTLPRSATAARACADRPRREGAAGRGGRSAALAKGEEAAGGEAGAAWARGGGEPGRRQRASPMRSAAEHLMLCEM